MARFLLKRWEGIELFIKIVTKYEVDLAFEKGFSNSKKLDKKIVTENINQKIRNNLNGKLRQYRNVDASLEFALKALKPIAEEFATNNYYPKVTNELCSDILENEPIIRTKARLELMLRYVGEENQIDRFENASMIDKKKYLFEDSSWYLFFREAYIDPISKTEKINICRVVIKFFIFGYMEIYYARLVNGQAGERIKYQGHYYTKNNKFLFVEGRVENERELRIIFKFKQDQGIFKKEEIVLGYYLNARENMNFGQVLIEKVELEPSLDVKIFKDKKESIEQGFVDILYWQYFEKQFSSKLDVKEISQKIELGQWLNNTYISIFAFSIFFVL